MYNRDTYYLTRESERDKIKNRFFAQPNAADKGTNDDRDFIPCLRADYLLCLRALDKFPHTPRQSCFVELLLYKARGQSVCVWYSGRRMLFNARLYDVVNNFPKLIPARAAATATCHADGKWGRYFSSSRVERKRKRERERWLESATILQQPTPLERKMHLI